jgi:RHS repeat-associated protein
VSVPSVQWGAVTAPSKAPTNLPHSRFFGHPHPAHGAVAQPFTWNAAYGYEWDCFADTGLYHVGARAYDPRTARWLQRDPIDAGGGDPNLYRYAGNDPVNRADPSGLAPEWVHGGLDLAGWIPGIGEAADLINAGLYALEGDWGNAGISALGIIPGLGDAAKAGRMGKRAKDLAEKWLPSNALYNRGGSKAPRHLRPAGDCDGLLYKVEPYNQLRKEASGTGLHAHHVPQAHPAEQVIPGYNRDTAPAILLPAEPHLQIPRRKGIYQGTSVDLILEDLGQLRQRFPDIPQSVLDELSELIRRSLGVDF